MSGAEFRENCTERGMGAILRRTDDTDTCIFLNAGGCSVHPDRPLVCRLYPLGRVVSGDGTERWEHAHPHPESSGEYTETGTIADYVEAQGAVPFMRAADGYAQWVRDVCTLLCAAEGVPAAEQVPNDLLDMDAAIAAYCADTGSPEPADIEDRRLLHMEILYEQLAQLNGGTDGYVGRHYGADKQASGGRFRAQRLGGNGNRG
jgi:Fe-S-cluster containining protein